MPKLKERTFAIPTATTCCWMLILNLSSLFHNTADAFVNNNNYKMITTTQTITVSHTRKKASTLFLLSQDLHQKMKYLDLERTGEGIDHADEAAVSASLYMNPAASKLAPHVQISWEPDAANIIKQLAKISNPSRPLMVGVVGIPGSGKSTSCEILAAFLEDEVDAMVMPMDGYHYSLEQLATFPDADDKIYRRGATDTFDPASLARDLERIAHGTEDEIYIPGFDHALGDPVPNQHVFQRNKHKVVICEGLYLLHDKDGWEHIQKFLDWTIFIEADVDVCIDRLKERNKCIPGYTPEEIEVRCEEVDRVNAELASLTAGKYASMVVQTGAILPKEDNCEII
ncbi:phosphoribulokinase / uridine kinase family protein [Nitzschia inconspicua]|uniref:Phosphoribulokinase / uridine kinase family protein n=1 Tax=Nitzschia inconspicua TaxID=303405 RepID=A0A9K3L5S6_9STRA|nr:phosphoribulokinase / uridine kinase family protein [Nitzschia inconspicua]